MMLKKMIIVVFLFAGVCVAVPVAKGADTIALTLPGDVGLEMVRIPAGSFMMGSGQSERGRYSDEGPVHKVTIGYDFYMGKFEVTQAQWMSVMDKNPAYRYGMMLQLDKHENRPVNRRGKHCLLYVRPRDYEQQTQW